MSNILDFYGGKSNINSQTEVLWREADKNSCRRPLRRH